MSDFRTILPPSDFGFTLDHQDIFLSLGSCFAVHIGQRLEAYKFTSDLNPFGILYNPVSIAAALHHLLGRREYTAADLFFHQELWHSFDHHGSFSHPDKEFMLAQINERLSRTQALLNQLTCLMITLGTAKVFVHKEENRMVANCHKLPGRDFYLRKLEPDHTAAMLEDVLKRLKVVAPQLNVILTVSPVRHIRDGLIENNRSKARLLLMAEEIAENHAWVHYFPSYELVMDDLRDYRFFEEDLVHPTDVAVDYVWKHFSNALFSEETKALVPKIEKIIRASQHRPFHPTGSAHQIFLQRQLLQINELEKNYSFLDFEKERLLFEQQLISQSDY